MKKSRKDFMNKLCLGRIILKDQLRKLCSTFIKLGPASRSALAALIIVLIEEKQNQTPYSAYERMIAVMVGCVLALLLILIFKKFIKHPEIAHSPSHQKITSE